MNLNHLLYLTDRPYRRARHLEMRRLAKTPGLNHLTVTHEEDGACCKLQAWPITLGRLVAAANADGLPTAGVVL